MEKTRTEILDLKSITTEMKHSPEGLDDRFELE